MQCDLAIKNANIVTTEGVFFGGIGVTGGKIAIICRNEDLPVAAEIIDGRENYLIPGLVDPHTHLLAPPSEDWKTLLQTETRAAAAGGVTSVVHCLMEHRGGSMVEALDRLRLVYTGNGYVDMACTSAVFTLENVREMRQALHHGIGAFKFFMAYRGSDADTGFPAADDGLIFLGFEEISRLVGEGYKTFARIHAETVEILPRLEERYRERNAIPATYTELRPPFLEHEAIRKCIGWAKETGCPLYIVHVTTAESLDLIDAGLSAGVDVAAETCPQYLVLHTGNTDLVLSKTNPPVRQEEDNRALWGALRSGLVKFVGTDHVAARKEDKVDFWTALGIPGLDTWLPLMLSEGVNKGRITMEQLVDVCCFQAAKKFGLAPRKGVIGVGSDADLVIVDLGKKQTVCSGLLHGQSGFSCYEGWELTGWPVLTMVRGNVICEEGEVAIDHAVGEFVPAKVT
ncbi:MAG: amidohydrolase family protein [Armatimonadetes bacterium]|nr:amidohydrolase family protein [Armatimonadota bacterium]